MCVMQICRNDVLSGRKNDKVKKERKKIYICTRQSGERKRSHASTWMRPPTYLTACMYNTCDTTRCLDTWVWLRQVISLNGACRCWALTHCSWCWELSMFLRRVGKVCTTNYFYIYLSQDDIYNNTTRSELSFVPTTEDDGKSITCRAENPVVNGLYMETSWKLDVVCT